jgi:hypothetical protein
MTAPETSLGAPDCGGRSDSASLAGRHGADIADVEATCRWCVFKIIYSQGKTMKKATILTTAVAGLLATAGLFAATSHAKDEVVAQNTTTVWIDGKGQQGFSEKLNKMHAQMEAKGFKFGDLEIYTEDGDMQGAFITYVR